MTWERSYISLSSADYGADGKPHQELTQQENSLPALTVLGSPYDGHSNGRRQTSQGEGEASAEAIDEYTASQSTEHHADRTASIPGTHPFGFDNPFVLVQHTVVLPVCRIIRVKIKEREQAEMTDWNSGREARFPTMAIS